MYSEIFFMAEPLIRYYKWNIAKYIYFLVKAFYKTKVFQSSLSQEKYDSYVLTKWRTSKYFKVFFLLLFSWCMQSLIICHIHLQEIGPLGMTRGQRTKRTLSTADKLKEFFFSLLITRLPFRAVKLYA